jgi:hypothetical protein
MKYGKCGH